MREIKKSHGRIIIDFNGADFDSKGINLVTEVRVEKCEHYDRSCVKSMAATSRMFKKRFRPFLRMGRLARLFTMRKIILKKIGMIFFVAGGDKQ